MNITPFVRAAFLTALLCLAGILITLKAVSQDTIFNVPKVLVVKQELSRKTDNVRRQWWRIVTVKSGYIVKYPDGRYEINHKIMRADHFAYKPEDIATKTQIGK